MTRRLQRHMVRVDGLRMHTVATAGHPRGTPAVVLVHGLALSGRYMLPTARALAPHVPVFVPDQPGFGDSDKPRRALHVPGLAEWLWAWMRAAGIERAAFMGNSFACQMIADLAARHPRQVLCAVLQGPTTPPSERSWLVQYIRWQQNSKFNPPEMDDIAYSDYHKCGYRRALRTFQLGLRDRIEDKLPRIPAPVLVVRGQKDPICHQWWAEAVAAALPRGQVALVPDAAHTLCFTHPDAMAGLMLQFLADSLRDRRYLPGNFRLASAAG